MKQLLALVLAVMLCTLTACGDKPSPVSESKLPSDHPDVSQEMPGWKLSGTVKEVLEVSEYTYCLVENESQSQWVAVPKTEIKTGEHVSLSSGLVMRDFYSKSLDRHFDEVVFCPGIDGLAPASGTKSPHGGMPAMMGKTCPIPSGSASTAPTQAPAPMTMPQKAGKRAPAIAFEDIKVEKAEGENGFRISELYERASELKGKSVTIRGKVIKVLAGIMDKNWIHIQDGTGNPEQNTHDLCVNSQQIPAVGDTITVSGTIITDKDFGSGFKYTVFIEDASISG